MKKIKKYIAIGTFIISLISLISLVIGTVFTLDELNIIDLDDFVETEEEDPYTSTVTDPEIKDLLAMSDEEVWQGLTGGLLSDIPTETLPGNANEITQAVENQLEDITVPIRVWADENNPDNFNKETQNVTITVNKFLAKLWTAFFTDLYNADENFVIASGFLRLLSSRWNRNRPNWL